MLVPGRLVNKLREFCDASYAGWRGFPTTRAAARHEWALAFDDYIGRAEEDILLRPPMPDLHPTLTMSGVREAFEGALVLADSISAVDSASDFATAWERGVLAISAGGAITDTALTVYSLFTAFTNVAAMKGPLLARLTAVFSDPTISVVQRLTDIANAFHAATDGLEASMTKTPPSSTPVVTIVGLA